MTITETLKRTVEVEAGDQHEAEQIVADDWRLGGYILDAGDFIEVEFEAASVVAGHGEVSMEGV